VSAQGRRHGFRFSVRNLDEHGEPGLTFHQRHDLAAVATAEEIAFPVSGYRTILRLGRPLPDRQGLGNPSTHLSFCARQLRFAHYAFGSKMPQQLFFQHGARDTATMRALCCSRCGMGPSICSAWKEQPGQAASHSGANIR